jgi:spore germination cell wall hydrolase CwlJ-like protein
MLMTTAALCLAANLYHEARGQHTFGQLLVAQVTMNRAGRVENVCATVAKPMQFSWTAECLESIKGRLRLRSECSPKEQQAWEHAKKVALAALAGGFKPLTCADHYHAISVRPHWAKRFRVVRRFQGHVFYASPRAEVSCSA